MVDEKLADDVCWVTVVATGYGDPRRRPARRSGPLEEPVGEPRVERRVAPSRSTGARDRSREPITSGLDLDVPEFVPRR